MRSEKILSREREQLNIALYGSMASWGRNITVFRYHEPLRKGRTMDG